MEDFTISIYRSLLHAMRERGYPFKSFRQYLEAPTEPAMLLRHDVDGRKENSLLFARIQHEAGLIGTYYFRMVPQSFDEGVIREIHGMGHEVGYHYEDMDFAGGDPRKAIQLFERHLEKLLRIVPVSTICMHGSPKSRYDNKDLWNHYNYRDYGIIGEPYFDIDFRRVFYLTDTGRRWDGYKVSVRDKVPDYFDLSFRTTSDIIDSIRQGDFPDSAMFNFHPQRWTDAYLPWLKEKYVQRAKNTVKYWVVKLKKESTNVS